MRLTKKTKIGYIHKLGGNEEIYSDEQKLDDIDKIIQKLGQIEDLMDKYGIKSVEELEHTILNDLTGEEAFREYFEANVMPYRNIEKELGINLLTLFKALTDTIAIKNKDGSIEEMWACPRFQISIDKSDSWILYGPVEEQKYVSIKDYGKTWALTREELE